MPQSRLDDSLKPSDLSPPCAMCGLPMFLSFIEPSDKPDHDRQFFQCTTCEYSESVTVKYNGPGNLVRLVFAPATSHSDSIARPSCSECGTATVLVGIEAERPGYDLHTFQCPKCEHFETSSALSASTLKLLLGKPRRRHSPPSKVRRARWLFTD